MSDRPRVDNQIATRRPDGIDPLALDKPDGNSGIRRDDEQRRPLLVSTTRHDPCAIRRPVSGALAGRPFDFDGRSQRAGVGAVCRHDRQVPFPFFSDDDGKSSVRRHCGRLGQRPVDAPSDLRRLSILDLPEAVASPAGGQIEQRLPYRNAVRARYPSIPAAGRVVRRVRRRADRVAARATGLRWDWRLWRRCAARRDWPRPTCIGRPPTARGVTARCRRRATTAKAPTGPRRAPRRATFVGRAAPGN